MLGAPPEGLLVPGKTHVTTWKQDATKYAATHHWPTGTTGQGVQGDREGHGRAPHTRSTFSRRRSRLDRHTHVSPWTTRRSPIVVHGADPALRNKSPCRFKKLMHCTMQLGYTYTYLD